MCSVPILNATHLKFSIRTNEWRKVAGVLAMAMPTTDVSTVTCSTVCAHNTRLWLYMYQLELNRH